MRCIVVRAIIGGTAGGIAGNEIAKKSNVPEQDRWKYIVGGAVIGAVGGGALGAVAAPAIVGATGVAGVSVTAAGVSTVAAGGATIVPRLQDLFSKTA